MKTIHNLLKEKMSLTCRDHWFCIFAFTFLILSTSTAWFINKEVYAHNAETEYGKKFIHPTGIFKTSYIEPDQTFPWSVGLLPDGNALIIEKNSRLILVKNFHHHPVIVKKPVAVIRTGLPNDEGLLGISIHPDFSRTRFFYLCLNVLEEKTLINRIELWKLSEDGTIAKRETVISSEIIKKESEKEIPGRYYVDSPSHVIHLSLK
jgi:hypothetical protein